MTFSEVTLRGSGASSRWLLLGSLALNLFFLGIGGALLVRGYGSEAPAQPSWSSRSMSERIDRAAARLPQEDAALLQAAFQSRRHELDSELAAYRRRQDAMRAALRAQPFDLDALKGAMTEMRAARQTFDSQMHNFLAEQASKMSPAGRQKLADWPRRRSGAGR